MRTFYEFFAGGGMARAGLGPAWTCLFANDFDPKKASVYSANWGASDLRVGDVARIKTADLPGVAQVAWASFPCQDLSLAGAGAGLRGERSGTFWSFWKIMVGLAKEQRAPKIIVLENVCGALTSHGGKDFCAIADAFSASGYRFGAVIIDAVKFVPQSRPRLFFIGTKNEIPRDLSRDAPVEPYHTAGLITAYRQLKPSTAKNWVWWKLSASSIRNISFSDIVDDNPEGVRWHTPAETAKLIAMMSPLNRKKLREAKRANRRIVGGIYKRTRFDENGNKVQRAEVRFDEIAGCLRTPSGGSSRQSIIVVNGNTVRSRLLAPREAARLMGLPDSYKLPKNYNEAYHVAGDGVVVPVVRFLAEQIIEPLLSNPIRKNKKAA